jgi:hypothetical protein
MRARKETGMDPSIGGVDDAANVMEPRIVQAIP